MAQYFGSATPRVDGPAKVTGKAKYAAEFAAKDMTYASVVSSTITKGRIAGIDTAAASRVAGVLSVLTHKNRPPMADNDKAITTTWRPAARRTVRSTTIASCSTVNRSPSWSPRRRTLRAMRRRWCA
jgi:CO/xanthine dehydrogenase Mo-binding subunit